MQDAAPFGSAATEVDERDGTQKGGEDDNGIDRFPTLPGPVDVLKVEPESEFVEGEGGSYTEEYSSGLVNFSHSRKADAEQAGDEEESNAEDEVMDVKACDDQSTSTGIGELEKMGDDTRDDESSLERDERSEHLI